MATSARKLKTQSSEGSTPSLLLDAAAAEFNERGFHGTDTNRIARRAGFAPQTFYRHFDDKTDVFIEVYARWQDDERHEIMRVLAAESLPDRRSAAIAASLLDGHRRWRVFRRSLRLLAVEEERVRQARARSRRAQLAAIEGLGGPAAAWEQRVAALLTIERLCDAAADDEVADLGIHAVDWTTIVARAVERMGALHGPAPT